MSWNIGTASHIEITMVCDSAIDSLYMDPPGVTVKRLGLGHAFDPAKGLTKMPVADNCSCMLIKIYALESNMIGAPFLTPFFSTAVALRIRSSKI